MDQKKLQHEMGNAVTFMVLYPDQAEYWKGYQRGLRRAYDGDAFMTDAEHEQFMAYTDDPNYPDLGRGYRDGLRAGYEDD